MRECAASNEQPGAVTPRRKAEHLRVNLQEDVTAKGVTAGFDSHRFIHCALPEIDLQQVSTSTRVLGRDLRAPLLISCMTGGTPEAQSVNQTLAGVAAELGLAIGVGSGRAALEHPDLAPTFQVRDRAPDALLFANLGAVQLNCGLGVDDCRRLLDAISADALVLHLNPLQEALQPDGDTCFGGLLARIAQLCTSLDCPVVVKEVGWGLDRETVRALLDAGVAAIDVAGAGGTSWSEVERHRAREPWRARVAAAFAGWGLPTVDALREARAVAPDALVFASGGVRDGLDVAKALALGADLAGLAGPFLRAAARGEQDAMELGRELVETLRVTMFCVGARSLVDLRRTTRLVPAGDEAGPRVYRETLTIQTSEAPWFTDITDAVSAVVSRSRVGRGQVLVYSHHTTAAICINEHEPLLLTDLQRLLQRLVPDRGYAHDDMSRRRGIPSDEPRNGHAHGQHLLLPTSETVPVEAGGLLLGSWQRLFLVELCSPRTRTVTVQVTG